jgi:hypothetical protein
VHITSRIEYMDGHCEPHHEETRMSASGDGIEGAVTVAELVDKVIDAHYRRHKPMSEWGWLGHWLRPIDRSKDQSIPRYIHYEVYLSGTKRERGDTEYLDEHFTITRGV